MNGLRCVLLIVIDLSDRNFCLFNKTFMFEFTLSSRKLVFVTLKHLHPSLIFESKALD
jgi:hypothetical protein